MSGSITARLAPGGERQAEWAAVDKQQRRKRKMIWKREQNNWKNGQKLVISQQRGTKWDRRNKIGCPGLCVLCGHKSDLNLLKKNKKTKKRANVLRGGKSFSASSPPIAVVWGIMFLSCQSIRYKCKLQLYWLAEAYSHEAGILVVL